MKKAKKPYPDLSGLALEKGERDTVRHYEPVHPSGITFRMIPFIAILSVLLIVGGIIYFVRNSAPFQICETFIRNNAEIRLVVGEVVECDFQLPLEVDAPIGKDMRIRYSFDVKGTKGRITVSILLQRSGDQWHILSASYRDREGSSRQLVDNTYIPGGKRSRSPGDGISSPGGKHLQSGHRAFKQNDFITAVAEYTRAIEVEPGNDRAYFWRGRAFAKQNLDDQALSDFKKTTELNPHNPDAFNWLGWLYRKKGACDEAINCFTRSISLRPKDGWAYYNRGRCYQTQGNTQKALDDIQTSCTLGFRSGCLAYENMKKH